VTTVLFLLAFALTSRGPVPRTTAIVLAFFAAFMLVYLLGFFNIGRSRALDQFTKGMASSSCTSSSSRHPCRTSCSATAFLLALARLVQRRGSSRTACYGVLQLLSARAGHNLDKRSPPPLTGGASSINVYGSVGGSSVYRRTTLTGDPKPSRDHVDRAAARASCPSICDSSAAAAENVAGGRARLLLLVLLSTLSRSGLLGLGVRPCSCRAAVPALPLVPRALRPLA